MMALLAGKLAARRKDCFAKNHKPWTSPKQALAPEPSAALRDRLVGELSGLASADEATAWAHRALGAKNTLRDVDAASRAAGGSPGFACGDTARNASAALGSQQYPVDVGS
jgi:phage-related baseplate assembly protein